MKSQTVPILLNLIAAVFGAFGQLSYKRGHIVVGALLFCLVMALFVWSYRMGGRISVVYPFYATTFIWGSLLGVLFENERMNALSYASVVTIVGGLALMAYSLRVEG